MIIRKLAEVPAHPVDMEGVLGATKQMVLGSADGVPNFSFRVFTLEPGGHTPLHSHPTEHLNYILSGQGCLVDEEGRRHPLVPGDFAFVPRIRNTSSATMRAVLLSSFFVPYPAGTNEGAVHVPFNSRGHFWSQWYSQ